MSDRAAKKLKAKKESMNTKEPPSKLQKDVMHWVRRNVPTKKTKFLHQHVVEYFAGSKAVDALVKDSPWAKDKAKEGQELVFEYREHVVEFMDEMLKHKFFHRAKKIPVQEKDKKRAKKAKDNNKESETEKETQDESKDKDSAAASSAAGGKKKRKIRLDMHLDQIFLDTQDAYVWLYDPFPWYYWVGGSAIVFGIIAVCLFPLWPPIMRQGVHYLSIAAAGFLVCIIALGVLKYIVFGLLFVLSGGKLKFWLFPNLTEDVGFLESFMPVYDYTYTGAFRRSKKAKDSDDSDSDSDDNNEDGDGNEAENSESDDSTSRKSSTGKDFEMVDKNDTDTGAES